MKYTRQGIIIFILDNVEKIVERIPAMQDDWQPQFLGPRNLLPQSSFLLLFESKNLLIRR